MGSAIKPFNDTRNFSLQRATGSKPPAGPPPVTPTSAEKLAAAMKLDEEGARAALLRGLEFFGASRLDKNKLVIPNGLGPTASMQTVEPSTVSLSVLEASVAACIADAAVMQGAPTSRDDGLPPNQCSLAARWLQNCPRFATPEHDATGIAVLLMWTFPEEHGVSTPLSTGEPYMLMTVPWCFGACACVPEPQ
jgi:hypothetical protein